MPIQPTTEELELKQHVTTMLMRQGVLTKIKAQLRAAVFHAMHDHEPDAELAVSVTKLREFQPESSLALAIVQDFLEFFQLNHALAVLCVEAGVEAASSSQNTSIALSSPQLSDAIETLGLQQHGKEPLLLQLLDQKQQHSKQGLQPRATVSDHQPPIATTMITNDGQRDEDDGESDDEEESVSHAKPSAEHIVPAANISSSSSSAGAIDRAENSSSGKFDDQEFDAGPLEKASSERLASIASIAAPTSRFDDDSDDDKQSTRGDDSAVPTRSADKEGDDNKEDNKDDEDNDDKSSESLASASELDESIAEEQSASFNYSQDYESASRDDNTSDVDDRPQVGSSLASLAVQPPAATSIRDSDHDDDSDSGNDTKTTTKQQQQVDEADDDEDEEPLPPVASTHAPPAPTSLSPLPSLTPLASGSRTHDALHQQDDDEFDEDLDAAHLSALDAKLKAMEAEDETGTLQQLKASLQMEHHVDVSVTTTRERDTSAVAAAAPPSAAAATDDDEPEGYGSDFEEDEVISEVSDDDEIESVADLSVNDTDDESVVLSTLQPPPTARRTNDSDEEEDDDALDQSTAPSTLAAHHDKPVDDENALNGYDYIEAVEKDW